MKVVGYFVYGEPYCLSCTDSLDLDLEEEDLEPIFSGDRFPYPLLCKECEEKILEVDPYSEDIEVDWEEVRDLMEEADEELEEGEFPKGGEELTCNSCPLSDFCPESGNPKNIDGACLTGFFYDLNEEEELDDSD
jgi:hypothetical protein